MKHAHPWGQVLVDMFAFVESVSNYYIVSHCHMATGSGVDVGELCCLAHVCVGMTQWAGERSKSTSEAHTIGPSEQFRRCPLPATTSPPPRSLTPPTVANKVRTRSQNHSPVRIHQPRIFAPSSTNTPAPTASFSDSSTFIHRKYGSGKVGAHASVGTHWYVILEILLQGSFT